MPDLRTPDPRSPQDDPRRRGNDPNKKDQGAMERRARTIMGLAVVVLGLLAFLQIFRGPSATQIRYDEFKDRLRNNQVEEVWLGPDSIRGRTRTSDAAHPANPPHQGPDFETQRVGEDKD